MRVLLFVVVLVTPLGGPTPTGMQGVPPAAPHRSAGVLTPGGVFTAIDGVTLDARDSSLDQPHDVFIERLADLAGLPPLGPRLAAVTPYYRFGSPDRLRLSEPLRVRIPLPEGAPTAGLAVFALASAGEVTDVPPDAGPLWSSGTAAYDAGRHEAVFPHKLLRPEGQVFVIVSGAYAP